jgi:hypothetical protein
MRVVPAMERREREKGRSGPGPGPHDEEDRDPITLEPLGEHRWGTRGVFPVFL